MPNWIEEEKKRKYHPVAKLFPLMQGEEFDVLRTDIAANGLLESIWLHPDGSIIDGRNRHRACIETGTPPQFKTWSSEGSLVGFVISMNLHRRHLTSSQRAAVAVDMLPMLEAEAKKRMMMGVAPDPSQKIDQGKATQRAAEIAQTNRQYVSDAKKLKRKAPELFERVKTGEVTIPQAKQMMGNHHTMDVMGSSESPEWYTPPHIIELTLRLFDGIIDTDPCSNSKDNPNVPATFLYAKEDDGLSQIWHGSVYMNPPYGKGVSTWTEALVSKYENGEIKEAIALLPGRIDTRWFQPLYDYLICNVRGRLNYPQSACATPFPSVIVYLGDNKEKFIETFKELGPIMKRIG